MDEFADRLAAIAAQLVGRVRDDDTETNARWLTEQLPDPVDWFRLCFALAAAVPTEQPWTELTAWTVVRSIGERAEDDGLDHIAIERAVFGDTVRLTRAERRAAVALLARHGLGTRQIARRLHITDRSVLRHLHELRGHEAA